MSHNTHCATLTVVMGNDCMTLVLLMWDYVASPNDHSAYDCVLVYA